MKYILYKDGGTHSNINKPNERKICTNMLFHLGFVEIISSHHEGVITHKCVYWVRSPYPIHTQKQCTARGSSWGSSIPVSDH